MSTGGEIIDLSISDESKKDGPITKPSLAPTIMSPDDSKNTAASDQKESNTDVPAKPKNTEPQASKFTSEMEKTVCTVVQAILTRQSSDEALSYKEVRIKSEKILNMDLKPHKAHIKRVTVREMELRDAKESQKSADSKSNQLYQMGELEWGNCWKGNIRKQAVAEVLDTLYTMNSGDSEFQLYGIDMIQSFLTIGHITTDPIRRRARTIGHMLALKWKDKYMQVLKVKENPSPKEVLQTILAIDCIEKAGLCHVERSELHTFLSSSERYPPQAYFGWDPRFYGPPKDHPSGTSDFKLMTSALTFSHYADQIGMTLSGVTYAHVFQWTSGLRPYRDPQSIPWREYFDQCFFITRLIFTASGCGTLRLEPELFSHELEFLLANVGVILAFEHLILLSEMIQSLHIFGLPEDHPTMRRGMAYVLQERDPTSKVWTLNSIFETSKHSSRTYSAFRQSTSAVMALLYYHPQGYGPSEVNIVPVLKRQYDEIKDLSRSKDNEHESMDLVDIKSDPRRKIMRLNMLKLKQQDFGHPSDSFDAFTKVDQEAQAIVGAIQPVLEAFVAEGQAPLKNAIAMDNLRQLMRTNISVALLTSSGIGKTVSKLRKYPEVDVSTLAKELLAKWKSYVKDSSKDSVPAHRENA